jgi:hypothetical protein
MMSSKPCKVLRLQVADNTRAKWSAILSPKRFGLGDTMKWIAIVVAGFFAACSNGQNQSSGGAPTAQLCQGVYYSRDAQGNLQKFNQFWQSDQQTCLTDKIALTNYEASTETRRKQNVTCVPQATFPTMALKAAANYYLYRNDRYYLDFDGSTGIFRRLTLGEDQNGNVVFQRDRSCFYARTDQETESVDPQNYGQQLLLDFSNFPASSADFVPNEIFNYISDSNGNWYFTRYDDVADWDYSFCPEITTPYANCTAMRNGNLYYYPTLDAATQTALAVEAKLIRTQFNFTQMTKSDFQSLWDSLDQTGKELQQGGDWRYFTNPVVDAPKLFDYDWRRYLMRLESTMPDVAAPPQLPPVCYSGSQTVNLAGGGTGRVYGQICFSNGVYTFIQR